MWATLTNAQYQEDPAGGGGGGGGGAYPEDNLYTSYAQKAQAREVRASLAPNGTPSTLRYLLSGLGGWALAKLHSARSIKNLKKKHAKEQKTLYTQYYNDVYTMQEQVNDLAYQTEYYKGLASQIAENAELEGIQRDYEEFKQPDVDGDDQISRTEFYAYVRDYLANYPGLAEKDYPKFEDFDHDHDGFVSFEEYATQMALQVKQAEWEQQYGAAAAGNGGGEATKEVAKGLKGLLGETDKAKNFNDLYAGFR